MLKVRQTYLDSITGLLMIWVITLHIFYGSRLFNTVYGERLCSLFFFAMPWFFFKAGMFFKQKPFKDELRSNFKRLLVPYIVFVTIGYILDALEEAYLGHADFHYLVLHQGKSLLYYGHMEGNAPMWFFLSIFLIKTIYSALSHISQTQAFKWGIACFFFGVAILLHLIGFQNPHYVHNSTMGLMFFALGDLLREKQFEQRIFGVCLAVFLIIFIFFSSYVDFNSQNVVYGYYLPFFLGGFAGIIVLNNIFKGLPETKLLSYIGKNSMVFFAVHMSIIGLVNFFMIISGYNFSPEQRFWVFTISMIIFLPLLNKLLHRDKLKWMLGE